MGGQNWLKPVGLGVLKMILSEQDKRVLLKLPYTILI